MPVVRAVQPALRLQFRETHAEPRTLWHLRMAQNPRTDEMDAVFSDLQTRLTEATAAGRYLGIRGGG